MRVFLAAIFGVLIGGIGIWFFEFLGHYLFPVNFKITTLEEAKLMMFKMPALTLVSVIVAQGIGLLIGLMVARLIDKKTLGSLFGVSGILLLMTILNLLVIPHPTWFMVTNLTVMISISILFIATRKQVKS